MLSQAASLRKAAPQCAETLDVKNKDRIKYYSSIQNVSTNVASMNTSLKNASTSYWQSKNTVDSVNLSIQNNCANVASIKTSLNNVTTRSWQSKDTLDSVNLSIQNKPTNVASNVTPQKNVTTRY